MPDLSSYLAAEKQLWDHYEMAPIERFVTLPNLGIRVRVLEAGQGEPVLFVHGSPNAAPKWAPLAARLLDFRCLLLDRPGCGLSEPVDYRKIDLRSFGSDLICSTLDGLGIPRAAVVASSLGGALALYFAHDHPERVTRLVLEGCPVFFKGNPIPPRHILGLFQTMLIGRIPSSESAFRQLGHARSMDDGRFESQVLVWRDNLLKHTETMRFEKSLNWNILFRGSRYYYDDKYLQKIIPPTLYLWGEDDPFGGSEVARRMIAAQPDAKLHSFPDSGHLPWLDAPAEHANLIRSFLSAHNH